MEWTRLDQDDCPVWGWDSCQAAVAFCLAALTCEWRVVERLGRWVIEIETGSEGASR